MGRHGEVLLVTCAAFPAGEDDARDLLTALRARDLPARWVAWDEDVDWAAASLAILRSTWDYPPRREEFLTWAARVPALANDIATVRWNSDKRYLADLAVAGVPGVPTTWVAPGEDVVLPDGGEIVVKPTVGAGSMGAGRFAPGPDQRERIATHVAALHAADRTAMLQPYLTEVDASGETALIFLGGEFSHAIRKEAMLPPGFVHPLAGSGPDHELFAAERITPRTADPAQLALAAAALDAVPTTSPLLYARVDLLPGPDGPVVVEVELVEPSLFLRQSAGATDRFADAIRTRLD